MPAVNPPPGTLIAPAADVTTGTWLSLDEVKKHLNYLTGETKDDAELAGYVQAACAWIDNEAGPTIATSLTKVIRDATDVLTLPIVPVLSLQTITEASPAANSGLTVDPTLVAFNDTSGTVRKLFGNWFYDDDPNPARIIWQTPVTITYTAGRTSVNPILRLAALRLVAHWWQPTQQMTAPSTSPFGAGGDEQTNTAPGAGYGIPYAVDTLVDQFRAPRRTVRSISLG